MSAKRAIRRLLAATDFSSCAMSAVDRAIELARTTGASVTLFHAYELRPPPPGSELAFAAFDVGGRLEAAARIDLDRMCVELRERFAPCPPLEGELAQGDAAVAIVAEARRGAYDLVVVGTRGRTGLRHFVLGSVAEQVIRHSPIPVLTVHEQVPPLRTRNNVTASRHPITDIGSMRVADVMSYQPVLIGAYDTAQEAADRMRGHVVGALPVLESGRLVGIITDRDLAIRVVARGHRPGDTYVRQVMTPDPASCLRDDTLETALERMLARHVRRLVVLDGQSEVIGLLSVDDLVVDDRTQRSALQVLRGSVPSRGELDGELPDVR